MTRKIKVLQLQNRYNVSASDLAEQVIEGLQDDRHEVTTAFLRGRPGPGEPLSRAAHSVYFGFSKSTIKGLRLRVLWTLYKHCRAEGYDAVIAHRFKPINTFMLLNLWLKIPVCIGVLHGLGEYDRAYRRWELHKLLSPSWRFVGVSRAVCDDLLTCGAGLTPDNVCQINNAIDISRAEGMQHPRARARELLALSQNNFIFGTIGRLVPVKGHIDLIEAFSLLKDEYPTALVAIIGEGRSRTELENAITRHKLEDRVLLLGEHTDALQYVKAFDAFIMPSLSEGLPLALLEGMSGHLPVAGSDIDSLRPVLEDCGARIFPVNQPSAMAKCLRDILNCSREQLHAEGERNYAYLCRSHAIENFRTQYRNLLVGMLGKD